MKKIKLQPQIVKNILYGPPPYNSPVILTHKNIYILPSKMGLIWFSLLSIMFLIGLNYRNNIVLTFCLFLIAFSMVSIIYTFFQLYHLKVSSPGNGRDCFMGGFNEFCLYLQESRSRIRYLKIRTEDFSQDFILWPNSSQVVKYMVRSKKRGIRWAPKISIISYYPLGIFRCWTVLRFSDQALVYPKPIPHPGVNFLKNRDSVLLEGDSGSGVEDFLSLDKYQPTDPSSKIYWKIYAKNNKLIKKIFHGGEGSTIIWLDLRDYIQYGMEKALGILCFHVIEASKKGQIYGLKLDKLVIAPDLGEKQKQKCLKALARYPHF